MHGDRAGFWNRAHMYPALGFERFVSKKDYEVDEVFGLGLSDGSFFHQSLAMLEAQERPFYAFLVTLSSHYPFGFPELLKAAAFDQGGEAEGTILRSYLAAIHYFDREFGKFIDGLKSSGLFDESVIIVYGDHAAIPKWDSASLSKLIGKDLDEEYEWREVNRVPFMAHVPGGLKLPYVKGRALGQIDIPASAASLLGVGIRLRPRKKHFRARAAVIAGGFQERRLRERRDSRRAGEAHSGRFEGRKPARLSSVS